MATEKDEEELERRLKALRAPTDESDAVYDDAHLQARLAALSPKRTPVDPSAAELQSLEGEEWLGEDLESVNTRSLPSPPKDEPSPKRAQRPGVSHRLSDAFSPIDVQIHVPQKTRSHEEEEELIRKLRDELAAESDDAHERERRLERLEQLNTGSGDETWLGAPPSELQIPADLRSDNSTSRLV